jgi:hypothetical protein
LLVFQGDGLAYIVQFMHPPCATIFGNGAHLLNEVGIQVRFP